MPNQATASDHTFYDIFVPQKVPLSKISDDVIACHFWFGPPPNQKPRLRLCTGGGGIFEPCPPKSLLVRPKREQTFVLVQEDRQTFAQKQVTTNAFFYERARQIE